MKLLSLLLLVSPLFGQKVTHFTVPVPVGDSLGSVVQGPDNAMWFTLPAYGGQSGEIGRVTASGQFTFYDIPSGALTDVFGITSLGDDLWFTGSTLIVPGVIYSVSTKGVFREYRLLSNFFPNQLVAGPTRGFVWFSASLFPGSESGGGNVVYYFIASMTQQGALNLYEQPVGGNYLATAVGPDDNIWMVGTNNGVSSIARMTTEGVFTEWPTITPNDGYGGIVAGPDGALWFTEPSVNQIGRITTSGDMSEFSLPSSATFPDSITSAGGELWFVYEISGDQSESVGKISTSGAVTLYPSELAFYLAAGPNGTLWSTYALTNQIGFTHLSR